jgi:hypothetical protein
MAYAMLFPEPAKLKRKGMGSLAAKEQFSEALPRLRGFVVGRAGFTIFLVS